MALAIESGDDNAPCTLTIDEDLSIYAIDALKQGLDEVIDSSDSFLLKLDTIEDIDSSGIQLLLAFKAELTRKQKTLTLGKASDDVNKLLAIYGLSEQFNWESAP